ncbi:MAG: accessory gene regulator B family protein, partial [Syntrophomonas sp.]
HMSTPARCLLVGSVQIVVLGIIATIPVNNQILYVLLAFTLIYNLVVIAKWVPGGTEKKPLTEPAVRSRSKRITLFITFFWITLILVLFYFGNTRYVLSTILGAFSAMFLVTPMGYRFNAILDVKPNLRKGGEQNEVL